jgi:hypothetical protein
VGRRAVPGRKPAAKRRTATAQTHAPGHRSGGHERHVSGAHPGNSARRTTLPGQPPLRNDPVRREPPRASTPTGPLVRARLRHFRRPPAPSLDEAEATVIAFGKFHDHTLGQIAAFEPSYIDWVAGMVSHDPDLVSAARVIQADLDRRGVARRTHPISDRGGRSA